MSAQLTSCDFSDNIAYDFDLIRESLSSGFQTLDADDKTRLTELYNNAKRKITIAELWINMNSDKLYLLSDDPNLTTKLENGVIRKCKPWIKPLTENNEQASVYCSKIDIDDSSNWIDFCFRAQFNIKGCIMIYELEILQNDSLRHLVIEPSDVIDFTKKYKYCDYVIPVIDWEKVKGDWDVVEIKNYSPWISSLRDNNDYMWYCAHDANCCMIFDPKNVKINPVAVWSPDDEMYGIL